MFGELLGTVDWDVVLRHCVRIGIAFALALPAGWNRERTSRQIGLRTFPLVAVASCGFILVTTSALADSLTAQGRVFGGLITGVGFVGGGAIVKQGMDVYGLATAVSIWNTAAIGSAVAFGRLEIALVLALLNFLVLSLLTPVKEMVDGHPDGHADGRTERTGGDEARDDAGDDASSG